MNARSFKVIFSKRLGALVAVGENATAQGKSASGEATHSASGLSSAASSAAQHVGVLKHICLAALMGSSTQAFALDANALPTGAELRHGAATVGTEGATMTINQTSSRATINWQSFNVGEKARVNVVQNDSQSVLLNRVVGNDMSQIRGQISANGQVVLVNPNGIVMGPTGRITASAFTASTFGISDTNFQDGHMKYERNGSNGKVVHQGHIQTTEAGGYVALIGAEVSNEGTIQTRQGAVVLAAAERVSLHSVNDMNSVSVPLSGKVRLELDPAAFGSANVTNSGIIKTEGGQVLLRAAAVVDAVSKVAAARVTHTGTGTIDTTGEQGGRVDILADNGIVRVSGKVKANSTDGTTGGTVMIGRRDETKTVDGKEVTQTILAAVGDASGATLESMGGFIETSGKFLKVDDISVKAKDWLLDPDNIEITNNAATAGWSKISADTISAALQTTNVIIKTTGGVTSTASIPYPNSNPGDGNIIVSSAIVKTGIANTQLTLEADNGITIHGRIGKASTDNGTLTGTLDVVITAKGVAASTGNSQGLVLNNLIDANGGIVTLSGTTSRQDASGVVFNSNSGIDAGSFKVTGQNTSTGGVVWPNPNGVLTRGTVHLTSTSNSKITGRSTNTQGHGTFIRDGSTLNINAKNDSTITIDTADDSSAGMRVGFNGGVTINSQGNVTLGSHNSETSSMFFQGTRVNASSGTFTLMGKSNSGIGVDLAEGAGGKQLPFINATGSTKVVVDGVSTNNIAVKLGSGGKTTINSATGAITLKGVSTNSTGIFTESNSEIKSNTGKITLYGEAKGVGVGVRLSNGSVTTGGVNEITGISKTGGAVIVESNVTIEGASVALKGTSTSGAGVSGTGRVTATTGNVQIDGIAKTNGDVGGSVSTNNNITALNGDININGTTATTNKEGVFIGGNTIEAKNIKIVGSSTGAGGDQQNAKGIRSFGTMKASDSITLEGTSKNVTGVGIEGGSVTAGGAVVIKGTSAGTNHGVFSSGAIESTTGGVSIVGRNTTPTGGAGTRLEGTVTANGDINLEGRTQATAGNQGLVILNAVSSSGGNITATAETQAGNQRALVLTTNGGTSPFGSLKVVADGKTININANTLFINGANSNNPVVDAGTTGTVNIKTSTPGNEISIGGIGPNGHTDHTATNLADQKLGIDQNELNRIKAGNLVIGDTASTGQITVSGVTTTAATTGNLTLQTGGSILVSAALTVGDNPTTEDTVEASSNLTLNATGASSTVSQMAAIKAAGLELLGASATHTLTNAGNQVGILAANTKNINYENSGALTLGTVNTIGIAATGNVSVATLAGDLTISESVATTATSTEAVTTMRLNAGKTTAAGTKDGGNIKVGPNGSVSVGEGGVAQLMSGSIAGTTGIQGMAAPGSGKFRYGSDEVTTSYSKALDVKSAANNGVNVIYREQPTIEVILSDITKAGNNQPFSGGSAALKEGSSPVNGDQLKDIVSFGGNSQGAVDPGTYSIEALSALGYKIISTPSTLTIAGEPIRPPAPVVPVPVTPTANPNVVVTLAAANNNFQLAGAEGQCSANTLEQCECEKATDTAGAAIEGIQLCYEQKDRLNKTHLLPNTGNL